MLTVLPLNLPPIMGSEIKKGVLNVIRICTGETTIEITIYAVNNELMTVRRLGFNLLPSESLGVWLMICPVAA